MLNRKRKEKEPNWIWVSVTAGLIIFNLFAAFSCIQFFFVQKLTSGISVDSSSVWGLSGDFFGFANAVFSALAFAMIIVTLWMQKYELSQQREELQITRDVMIQQQLEMKDQNESLQKQRFESTFFNLLNLHGDVTAAIRYERPEGVYHGRVAIHVLLDDVAKRIISRKESVEAVDVYDDWYRSYDLYLGHYFRTLYNLFRLIEEHGGEEQDKFMYARLVRAQLTSVEVELLLYNGLGEHGHEKFKPLIEKYTLLKHLPVRDYLEELADRYSESARRKV